MALGNVNRICVAPFHDLFEIPALVSGIEVWVWFTMASASVESISCVT